MPISATSLPPAPRFAAGVCRAVAVLPGLASRVTSAMVNNNDRARPLWYRALALAQTALVASRLAGPSGVVVVPAAASLALFAARHLYDTPAMQHVVAMHSLNAAVDIAKYLLVQDGMLGPGAQVMVAQVFTALLYETNNISAVAGLLRMVSAHPGVMAELKGMAAEHGLPLLHTVQDALRWLVPDTGEWAVGSLRERLPAGLVEWRGGMSDATA